MLTFSPMSSLCSRLLSIRLTCPPCRQTNVPPSSRDGGPRLRRFGRIRGPEPRPARARAASESRQRSAHGPVPPARGSPARRPGPVRVAASAGLRCWPRQRVCAAPAASRRPPAALTQSGAAGPERRARRRRAPPPRASCGLGRDGGSAVGPRRLSDRFGVPGSGRARPAGRPGPASERMAATRRRGRTSAP